MLGVIGITPMTTVHSSIIMRTIPTLIAPITHLTFTRMAIGRPHIVAISMPVLDGPDDDGGNLGRCCQHFRVRIARRVW